MGNATDEHYYAGSVSVVGLSLPVISKTTFQRHRRQKLSNNITQNKGMRGSSSVLRLVLPTARWAESNAASAICLPSPCALSFPPRVPPSNQQLMVPRDREQGLPAPRALGGQGSLHAQQDSEKGESVSAAHLAWQETAKTPLRSFRSQGSLPMAMAKADRSKATRSGASQGRHDEEEPCSEATGAPWKSPVLPLVRQAASGCCVHR